MMTDSQKARISIFVYGNTLKLHALKFDFCVFCAYLRPYLMVTGNNLDIKKSYKLIRG